ncbi:MAG: T9SS C-terminal target domain-containing protein [Sphingobacteriales bacterium]|nr:MAG: T9SS C-terminal target domain-containing protein [Sphingobacteriales bacterium]
MKKHYTLVLAMLFAIFSVATAQISLTTTTYTQDFNTLASTGTSSTLPMGWLLLESGTNANATYTASTGSSNSGETYSFGAAANAERAFGGVLSGSLTPTIGAGFTNNTGGVITSLAISFTGEQWRLGATGRNDRLDFQYSTDATGLSGGLWTDVNNLDFTAPNSTGTVGALDGNATANRTAVSFTITGLNIANGATFYIRWNDSNASGADDGLAIDDFSIIATTGVATQATITAGSNATEGGANGTFAVNLSSPAPVGGVTVNYSFTGTAILTTDYTDALSGSITIIQGASTGTITLVAVDDATGELTETITCTLTSANNGYTIGAPSGASINLIDNDVTSLYNFTFATCSGALSDGFTAQSVTGTEAWACTTFGQTTNAVEMNGFNGTALDNEDWLVSPTLDLSTANFPLLSFYSKTKFVGPQLQLFITTNYTGNVSTTVWTELNGRFPEALSNSWRLSNDIDLSAYKQANVRIAFKYTSSPAAGASRWNVDEINIINASSAPAPVITNVTKFVDTRDTTFGNVTLPRTFTFRAENLAGNLTVTAPTGFELSKDGNTYNNSIIYTAVEANSQQVNTYLRLNPLAINQGYNGFLNFSTTGLNTNLVFAKGNSYPRGNTLNIVNWNIEWFGGAQGPADDQLQEDNTVTAMNFMDADIYALGEIVSETRLQNLTTRLANGPWAYKISYYCSGGTTAGTCASSQKLAFLYKTSVVTNVTADRAMMISSASANTNFATGRLPYLMTATVTKNSPARTIHFIALHAKAGDTQSDYDRRFAGATELKDTLNAQFSNANVIILGDFNDDLDSTITASVSPRITSYDNIVKDSVDTDSYVSTSLAISRFDLNSTYNNDAMVDHLIMSNELAIAYVGLSSSLLSDIGTRAGITNFSTTTSDHFPLMTRFDLSVALPVKLNSFGAVRNNQAVVINWKSAEEINSKDFTVERAADGRNFTAIASVAAKGTASAYSITDNAPVTGNNFYRLKMTDKDGRFEYSKVVKVNFSKSFSVRITPNPASTLINVAVFNAADAVTVQLIDGTGKVVKQQRLSNLQQNTSIDVQGLAKGIYTVKLVSNAAITTEKIMIQ